MVESLVAASPKDTLKNLFKVHEDFCKVCIDAYLLATSDGEIVSFNQIFSQMVGMKPKQIIKTGKISEVLSFSKNNLPLNIGDFLSAENFHYDNILATKTAAPADELVINLGSSRVVHEGKVLGVFLVMRDITAETQLVDKNKSRENQSLTDALTGIYNRNFISLFVERETKTMMQDLASGLAPDFSIIMVDIDKFKKVNDVYGHQAGDYVLQIVASTIKKSLRTSDVVARFGGEEFMILLPKTDLLGAAMVANKIRLLIAAQTLSFGEHVFSVTASFGVSQWLIAQETFEKALERSDSALYNSKHSGRNAVTYSEPKNMDFTHQLFKSAS